MGYFFFVKPNFTGMGLTASLYISGSWQDRSGSNYQVVQAFGGNYRELKVSSSSLPSGKKLISLNGGAYRFFKIKENASLSSPYATARNTLLNGGTWQETTYADFQTANSLTLTETNTQWHAKYTTDDSLWTWAILFPATSSEYYEDDVAYYNLSFSLSNCTSNVSGGSYAEGTSLSITITPDSGYKLTSAPSVTGATISWTKVGTAYRGTVTINQDVTISKTATLIPSYTVSSNLSNCTWNYSATTKTQLEGTTFEFVITPDSGYELNNPPTVTGGSISWTKDGDIYRGTYTFNSSATITATATLIPVYRTVTVNLGNCDCNQPSTISVLDGTTLDFVFTPHNGYYLFNNPPVYSYSGGIATEFCTYVEGETVFTGSITISGHDYVVTANASTSPGDLALNYNLPGFAYSPTVSTWPYYTRLDVTATPLPHYTVTVPPTVDGKAMELTDDTYHLTVWPYNGVFIEGTAVEEPYFTVDYRLTDCYAVPEISPKYYVGDMVEITINAPTGMYFQTPPYVVYHERWGSQVKTDLTPIETSEYVQHYVWAFNVTSMISNVYIVGVTQAIPLIEDFGAFNVYSPTLQELTNVANMRYDFSEDKTYYYNNVDLGTFILSLMKVYVPFETSVNAEMVLGGYRTGVHSATIVYPFSTVNCGNVLITPQYENELDYTFTTLTAYIPFLGFRELDTVKYMGKTITLVYEVELITGNALVLLKSEDDILDTFKCRVAMDVPYVLSLDMGLIGKYDYNEYLLMDKTPYIKAETNLPYNTDHIRGKNNIYTSIGNLSGYQELDIIPHGIKATKREIEMLIQICKNGVYV